MLNALRRVISDASEIGDQAQADERQQEEQQQQPQEALQSPGAPPHTILMEEDEDPMATAAAAAPPAHAMQHEVVGQSDNYTANSSLSDDSSAENSQPMDEDEEDTGAAASPRQNQPSREPKENNSHSEGEDVAMKDAPMATSSSSNNKTANEPNVIQMETYPPTRTLASRPEPTTATTTAQQQQQRQPTPKAVAAAALLQRMDSATNDSSGSSGSHRNTASQTSSRDWGWFEEIHVGSDGMIPPSTPSGGKKKAEIISAPQEIHAKVNEEAAAMAVTAPTYVLEESLSSQKLWKHTAGNRPPQPMEERAFYEKMWAQNFARSQVNYNMPAEVLTATSPISLNPFADGVFEGTTGAAQITDYNAFTPPTAQPKHANIHAQDNDDDAAVTEAALIAMQDMTGDDSHNKGLQQRVRDGELTVLLRGPNAFGTTVSKSFARSTDNGAAIVGVDTVNISIASYRVVESRSHGKYAQFLVIYREGSIRDTVGVWKRYRDFEELSNKVTHAHEGCAAVIANMSPLAMTEEPETEHLPNAITSWRLLKKRKRWYRCLDAGYLSLKVFLLERFLHDILFESSSPKLLRDFVLGPEASGI